MFDPAAGAYVGFEGWIRNENDGQRVLRLEYEAYAPLAVKEGEKVIAEAQQKYPLLQVHCVHRSGLLEIGECAVWVGVAAAHRDEAFHACRFVIDQVKSSPADLEERTLRQRRLRLGQLRTLCCPRLDAVPVAAWTSGS